MAGNNIRVERPSSREQLEQFARLPFQVYGTRDAWWPPDVQNEIDLLARRSLLSAYLDLEPFCAWRGNRLVARVTAIVNRRYIEHWHEPLGQLIHFEALDDEDDAVAAMIAESANWLRERCEQDHELGYHLLKQLVIVIASRLAAARGDVRK